MEEKTVSAISTHLGRAGIAVIRISGCDAIETAQKMFRAKSGRPLSSASSGSMVYGDILYSGEVIDDGLAAVFFAPHSFTGEDTVEINCHGGILLARKVLESSFLCGAFPAGAGEFTKRAFLSGHIALSQAEAVIDLIDAKSEGQLALATAQTHGRLSGRVGQIYNSLSALVAKIYVDIDYPGEELVTFEEGETENALSGIIAELKALSDTYRTGHAVAEGIPVVIAGKPNTGKSSVLNMLLGCEKAIVTSEAGTTRDVVEDVIEAGPVLLKLTDTAGLRDAGNEAERIGIDRSLERLRGAELVLAVFDSSSELSPEDMKFISVLEEYRRGGGRIIALLNKNDLPESEDTAGLRERRVLFDAVISVSAAKGDGRDEIIDTVESLYIDGAVDIRTDAVVTNARQFSSLLAAQGHLEDAQSAISSGISEDIAGTDMELALSALGELDGRQVSEDIVNGIFSRFCVGK